MLHFAKKQCCSTTETYTCLACTFHSLVQVYTAGGGAKNKKWLQMRERRLQVPVLASTEAEACYGAALLAARSQAH